MEKAVILLSGGLDSATCLAIAKNQCFECYCLCFNYNQRHRAELAAAGELARTMQAQDFQIISIDLGRLGGSALTDYSIAVPTKGVVQGVIPVTYVPARNTIFLSYALAWAEVLQAEHIFIGANAIDYSNYPDCRPEYISAFQAMARLATKQGVEGGKCTIHAPLLSLSKSEIISHGIALGVDYSKTISCYQADHQGRACRICDACRLRIAGFEKAGIPDPTRYQP